jgi:DMATS type aromatic prenyltransferase
LDATSLSIRDFAGQQLNSLLHSVHLGETAEKSVELLSDTLGPGGFRALNKTLSWPSDVADDNTPYEFSTAFADGEPTTVRVLVEPTADEPGPQANLDAALDVLDALVRRYDLPRDRFDAVRDLFLPADPQGTFSLWFSLVFRKDAAPAIKVYFNPEVRGEAEAPLLVAEGLTRLGFGAGHQTVVDHALRRGPGLDRYSFFALDLTEDPLARVKVYISHFDATATDAEEAARAAEGVEPGRVQDFCLLSSGTTGPFTERPLISSYTFMAGDVDRPSGYSLYVPVRCYVEDDQEARARVLDLMTSYDVDPSAFENALASLARRPLDDGVGLIAHVSLRMGAPRPGVTVYLSSEAYDTAPPRAMTLAH